MSILERILRGQQYEQQQTPCHLAARFVNEQEADQAYTSLSQVVHSSKCNLSGFKYHSNGVWHVAILGDQPPPDLEKKLQEILSVGQPTSLIPATIIFLQECDSMMGGVPAPWIECHYRLNKRS